jgi:hypothetical protein
VLIALSVGPVRAGVVRLTHLPVGEPVPLTHAPGPVVWQNGPELVLWDGVSVRDLTGPR